MAAMDCRRFAFGPGVWALLVVAATVDAGQQVVDPDFKATVERPAYRDNGLGAVSACFDLVMPELVAGVRVLR